ncbi:MAG: TetR/AcrR family transcriptional regulator [Micromonosporaceae bacterium]
MSEPSRGAERGSGRRRQPGRRTAATWSDATPGAGGRVARKRAERIRRAEEAAARIFAERGYDGANFDDIARELGLRGPSLYHYFPSKEAMFLQCVEHAAAEVIQRLEVIAGSPGPPAERLRRLFAEQVLIEVRDYPAYVPLFLKMYVPVPRIQARLAELKRAHGDVIRRVALECAQRRGMGSDEVRVGLLAAFGALAFVQEWYHADGPMSPEQLADALSRVLVAPFAD